MARRLGGKKRIDFVFSAAPQAAFEAAE